MNFPFRRLKHVADIRASNVDKKSTDGDIPVELCNYVDVYKNDEITRDIDFMSATASPEQVRKFTLRAGDVIITKDSETPADIGVPAFVSADLDGVVCGYHLSLIRADSNKLEPAFLAWVLRSKPLRHYFMTKANGITRFALGYNDIGNAPIPLPSIGEQREIVSLLDREIQRAFQIQHTLERVRVSLEEYKEATVAATVTGQGSMMRVP